MARGKYSPCFFDNQKYGFNCYGQKPEEWDDQVASSGVQYNDKTMGSWFDSEGFDTYGYSAFDAEGNYVGTGRGVDRLGYTEDEYFIMDDNQWEDACVQATEYLNSPQLKLI